MSVSFLICAALPTTEGLPLDVAISMSPDWRICVSEMLCSGTYTISSVFIFLFDILFARKSLVYPGFLVVEASCFL